MAFNKAVFINCPFDQKYLPLLRALVFTILYLEYEPRLSLTRSSSTIRISQIKTLIRSCKYGIHDLSRSKPLGKNDLPRLNMPFELGMDAGCHYFGNKKFKQKKMLILETSRYHYQRVISDIAGQDIEDHNDNPKLLVQKVRNWFSLNSRRWPLHHHLIWNAYNQFMMGLYSDLQSKIIKKDIDNMTIDDFIRFVRKWLVIFRTARKPESR